MNLDEAVAPLLNALTRMQSVQRHLHHVHLDQLKEKVGESDAPLQAASDKFAKINDPVAAGIRTSISLALKAIAEFHDVPSYPQGIFAAYRALRYTP